MNRNPRKRQLRALIYAFFIVSAMVISPAVAKANITLLDENFDSYSPGVLSGQGDWELLGNTSHNVSSLKYASSPYSVQMASTSGEYFSYKFFPATSTYFYSSFWVKAVNLKEGNYAGFSVLATDESGPGISFYLKKEGGLINGSDGSVNICEDLSEDVWYKFELEAWSSGYGRRQCNGEGWTATSTLSGTWPAYFNLFRLYGPLGGTLGNSYLYIDDIFIEGPGAGGAACDQWENSSDCIAGGCYWERIMFQEEYSYCREIATSTEGYCDYGIFDCAYCNSSSTCAGATGCFWNTIKGCTYLEQPCEFDTLENCENETDCENASGTWNGDFCFSSAVKEDCSGMSLTEGFLCQIKNFLSSMFLPSKAKLAELQQNIDLINTRFPSNYLKQSYNFLGNIRDGIASSTGITFGIMNATGTVSFSVLEHSTGTGGVATVKGVFFIFFNTILSIGFIKWALNFLSRIFK